MRWPEKYLIFVERVANERSNVNIDSMPFWAVIQTLLKYRDILLFFAYVQTAY